MKTKRLQFLDGIRGWGALTVLVYHVFIDTFPFEGISKEYLEKVFFLNGTLAVWLFFISSGFSLSIGFLQTEDRNILRNIALGRYLRLALPILFFSLLMWIVCESHIIPPVMDRPEKFREFFLQQSTFLSVLQFSLYDVFFDYSAEHSFIPPLWTMSIEFIGSALTLSLCSIFGTLRSRTKIFFILFWALYYFKFYYMCAFCAGIFFSSIYFSNQAKKYFWLPFFSFILAAILAIKLPTSAQKVYLATSVAMFYGMIYCTPITSFFQNKVSVFLGKISFTLYLLHSIIIWSFTLPIATILKKNGSLTSLNLLFLDTSTVLIALVGARLFYGVDKASVMISHSFSNYVSNFINLLTKKCLPKL